jgi:hypothetical protein
MARHPYKGPWNFLWEGFVLAIACVVVAIRFPQYLREACFVVLFGLTLQGLWHEPVRMFIRNKLLKRNKMIPYFIVAILGAVAGCGYWRASCWLVPDTPTTLILPTPSSVLVPTPQAEEDPANSNKIIVDARKLIESGEPCIFIHDVQLIFNIDPNKPAQIKLVITNLGTKAQKTVWSAAVMVCDKELTEEPAVAPLPELNAPFSFPGGLATENERYTQLNNDFNQYAAAIAEGSKILYYHGVIEYKDNADLSDDYKFFINFWFRYDPISKSFNQPSFGNNTGSIPKTPKPSSSLMPSAPVSSTVDTVEFFKNLRAGAKVSDAANAAIAGSKIVIPGLSSEKYDPDAAAKLAALRADKMEAQKAIEKSKEDAHYEDLARSSSEEMDFAIKTFNALLKTIAESHGETVIGNYSGWPSSLRPDQIDLPAFSFKSPDNLTWKFLVSAYGSPDTDLVQLTFNSPPLEWGNQFCKGISATFMLRGDDFSATLARTDKTDFLFNDPSVKKEEYKAVVLEVLNMLLHEKLTMSAITVPPSTPSK